MFLVDTVDGRIIEDDEIKDYDCDKRTLGAVGQ